MGTFYIEWFTNNVPTQPVSQSQNCNDKWDSSLLSWSRQCAHNWTTHHQEGKRFCAKLTARDRKFVKIKANLWFFFVITMSRADIHNHRLVRVFNSVLGIFGGLFRMNEPLNLNE